MEQGMYHRTLRVSALILALVLLFVSGLVSERTAQLAEHTQWYLANAVGVSVGVEESELNQITAALTQQERELAEREAALQQREIDVGIRSDGGGVASGINSTLVLSVILFILLVLIVLNYILDFVRSRASITYDTSAISHS